MKKFLLACLVLCLGGAVAEAGPLRNLFGRIRQARPVQMAGKALVMPVSAVAGGCAGGVCNR